MPSAHARRVERLLELQGADPRERALCEREVVVYEPWQTRATGGTFFVVLEDGTEAFHKRHDTLRSSIVADFGHSLDTPPIHECAAWHFAKALGEEYERLLPVTVYRRLDGQWGSLAVRHPGRKPGTPAFVAVPDQVDRAGLFDVLVGQQDRHVNNFIWDPGGRRLLLFDHGFCFPGRGRRHRIRSAALQRQRRFRSPRLRNDELELIEAVRASGDLLGIAPLLEPERADRMRRRLDRLAAEPHAIPRPEVT